MKYYYDTEFLEDGKTIELISIGIVAEDGREYYAVNRDAPWERIKKHEWLMANVVPSLPQPRDDMPKSWPIDFSSGLVVEKKLIAAEVREFLRGGFVLEQKLATKVRLGDEETELWADYAAYDHVALCQLWGSMIQKPEGIPMFTNDIEQECERLGNPDMPTQEQGEHNALADARHAKVMAEFLVRHQLTEVTDVRTVGRQHT